MSKKRTRTLKHENISPANQVHTRTNWKYNLIFKIVQKTRLFPPDILASSSDAFLSYHLSVAVYNYWKKMLRISTITETNYRISNNEKGIHSDSVNDKTIHSFSVTVLSLGLALVFLVSLQLTSSNSIPGIFSMMDSYLLTLHICFHTGLLCMGKLYTGTPMATLICSALEG